MRKKKKSNHHHHIRNSLNIILLSAYIAKRYGLLLQHFTITYFMNIFSRCEKKSACVACEMHKLS